MLIELKKYDLVYLATPYTKYPRGIEAAFQDAAALTADLIRFGIKVYSPIVQTHPLAKYGKINPLDHSMWLPFDETMMKKSDALLVAMMEGWDQSYGIGEEIKHFLLAGKPIYHFDLAYQEFAA